MLLPALLALATLLPRLDAGIDTLRARAAGLGIVAVATAAEPPRYLPETRAVSNWRVEAAGSLTPLGLALVARYAAQEPAFVARCVRLNNGWCIKRAHWPGEIGGDGEGHTAFATAADGADAAVSLLSRYYRAYGRRSALAIVRRWAPAECRLPGAGAPAASRAPTALAPRGLAGTVRARFLARHFRGGAPRRAAVRGPNLRVQPWSARARLAGRPSLRAPLPALRPVPDIATGLAASAEAGRGGLRIVSAPGLSKVRAPPSPEKLVAESAALPSVAGGSLLDLIAPPPLCSDDEVRIGNYASRIAGSVGLKAGDDLALFSPDGRPLPNLAAVLLAMSAVELGTLHATPALVAAAIARRTGP